MLDCKAIPAREPEGHLDVGIGLDVPLTPRKQQNNRLPRLTAPGITPAMMPQATPGPTSRPSSLGLPTQTMR